MLRFIALVGACIDVFAVAYPEVVMIEIVKTVAGREDPGRLQSREHSPCFDDEWYGKKG